MHVAVKLLDSFFLDGPKFLFWIAVGILKVNEDKLISKGKDDDIFVAVLKDFLTRIGLADSEAPADSKQQDFSVMTGKPLYDLLMNTACNILGPLINNEVIETSRIQNRLKVVHQMEDTNRKSQIRTLCEQVTLTFDEIGVVYDEVRNIEFYNDQMLEDLNSSFTKTFKDNLLIEDSLRSSIASYGGWGLVSTIRKPKIGSSSYLQKTISLVDFQRVFKIVSPFRHEPRNNSKSWSINNGIEGELSIGIVERIYMYCSFQYHYVQRQKKREDPGFIVDLAAMIQALDTIMKQPLHTRLRFLFDLHDVDGDSFLNNNELKQAMDSLLEMFQKSQSGNKIQAEKEEENYLKAISSFLTAALQMGNNKDSSMAVRAAVAFHEENNVLDFDSKKPSATELKQPGSTGGSDFGYFRLSYNEFLLAILSQSVFVEYFERKWFVTREKTGEIIVSS